MVDSAIDFKETDEKSRGTGFVIPQVFLRKESVRKGRVG